MSYSPPTENDFLRKITGIIEDNIANERFGVSELALEIGMSRSNLLRKINKLTQLSVSQYIRKVRLERAMELLKGSDHTVSEVSFMVGFGSTSYFIKCFRDRYGYPPGEAGKRALKEGNSNQAEQPSHIHRLAAIMFTDIQGYTALMQRDEVKAVELRNRHRTIFNEAIEKFNGKILQYFGDGTLSTFHSAIDAVRCGIEMQLAFREEPQIPVRIGIHSGDIIFTKDDIIGDGVNVASRIEALAAAGSVCISEKIYDEVKNQPGIQAVSMGVFELKNVDKPIEVFAIANPGMTIPDRDQVAIARKNASRNGIRSARKKVGLLWIITFISVTIIAYLLYQTDIFKLKSRNLPTSGQTIPKKSIAVLPFINDSDDSSNVYIINGLMESIMNNLQKIEDLRVISRTSIEKYRNNRKLIPEIAQELNVTYLIEGSGQKIGDQILLNIQLIEASQDKHLWARQYNREVKDIFKLQQEVAKNIADEIQVYITPEEKERIEKDPTDNLIAYDYFLQGLDLFYKENFEDAIGYFQKAIEHDSVFARAYANIAISYYFLDLFQAEKKYSRQINYYADKAFLFDSKLPQSLVAKALFYMNSSEYELALPYLEKALEYHPNSPMVINLLSELYTNYIPDTEKYLEYALKGIRLDIAAHDSITASYIYLHISNAFIQSGFVAEAKRYINKSLAYNPENLFSAYVKAYIGFSEDKDLQRTKKMLIEVLRKDTTRLDVLQEVGKICYYMRDFDSAYHYYKRYTDMREAQALVIYPHENAKIGLVFSKMGLKEKSDMYFADYKEYAENDNSIYKHLNLAMYHAYMGDTKNALEHLRLFSYQKNYQYWVVLFLEMDPLIDSIKDLPEFRKILHEIDKKFWNYHRKIKSSLEQQGLI